MYATDGNLMMMSVLTYIAVVLVGQAVFAALCGAAWLVVAVAVKMWPSKLLATKTSEIDDLDDLEEFLNAEYANLSR